MLWLLAHFKAGDVYFVSIYRIVRISLHLGFLCFAVWKKYLSLVLGSSLNKELIINVERLFALH